MTVTLKAIARTEKSAHQQVRAGQAEIGEIWREQVSVVVSKLAEPRRMGMKWRWFAKQFGSGATLGRGTRAAMLLGPGFNSRNEAISALVAAGGAQID
ncbi:hypothetical protein [Burkholderia sp. MBR-1]|uniref:hypothetical protein n=1 Tax=Burkholderia sp. MBR-1 TaxID=2732364 RepID=UPI0015EEA373|nr:hypothetical protein [Burkholderia sp. MBR-1]QMI49986.1 hypothetical protein MBR110_31560 [Burkholderia sp. MBR-1]